MKKVLIGMAAAAMAVVGTGAGSASAGATDTIFDNIVADNDGMGPLDNADAMEDFLRDAGADDLLDSCSGKLYTVFFPEYGYLSLTGLAAGLGYASLEDALDLAADTVKGVLALHIVKGIYDEEDLMNGTFTNLTNLAGLSLTIEANADGDDFEVNGNDYAGYTDVSCNGRVHYLSSDILAGADAEFLGIILPPAKAGDKSCGADLVGECPAGTGTGTGTGSGLPKTGSESMALTYAALASLIAGAGVLVIRRRSIA